MFKFFFFNFFFLIFFNNIILFYFEFFKNNIVFILFKNFFLIDIFALILLITTISILIVCIFITDNKYFFKNKNLLMLFNLFFLFIFGLVFSNNVFSFFLFYEMLLIPSYFLILKSSPNKRSKIVSNYFLLWTQLGSFLVLLGLFFQYNFFLNFYFFNYFNFFNSFLVQILIFFGFGIKIPLWPFHFWLSKTHVEANTGFSIFLSGILVKAAIFGLYKFIYLFSFYNNWFFLTICFISLIDASLKMCIQNDLKKLVAYSTIQEMAFMTLLLLLPSIKNNNVLYLFVIFHTLISGLYFWIVDCIYRRYNSRVVFNIQSLLNYAPKFSILLFISIYLFMGLPFTIKFSIEIFIFKILLNFNIFLLFVMGFFINYLCMLFFFKIYMYINFNNNINIKLIDVTKKEIIILFYFIFLITLLNFF